MDEGRKKDFWDKISASTPLILGLAITGVGGLFTQIYNNRQLDLNKIEALDKLRPLLTSSKPEEREFGYASFRALGYEQIAIRIIQVNKDESGRAILLQITKTASPETKAEAETALKTLDEARKLVNIAEFGKSQPDPDFLKTHPDYTEHLNADESWAKTTAKELGMSFPLAIALLEDTSAQMGRRNAGKLKDLASTAVPAPLNTRDKQTAWLIEYLDHRDRYLKALPNMQRFSPAIQKRLERYRRLIEAGDWELKSVTAETEPVKER